MVAPLIRLGAVLSLVAAMQLFTAVAASAAEFGWMKGSDAPASGGEGVTYYATLKGGAFFPDTIDNIPMNTGTGAEIGIGVKPLPFMAAELTAGYFETDNYDNQPDNYHQELSAVPVMLSIKAIVPLKIVEPYLTGGMGFHYAMRKYANNNVGGTATIKSDDLYSAFQYGGGIRILDRLSIEARKVEAFTGFADRRKYSGIQLYGSVDIRF